MPIHQHPIDQDKTLTKETQKERNLDCEKRDGTNQISNDNERNGQDLDDSGEVDDCIDKTLKGEYSSIENAPLLVKIIAESVHVDEDLGSQQNSSKIFSDNQKYQSFYAELDDVLQVEKLLDENWLLAKSDRSIGRLAKNSCRVLDDDVPVTLCRYLMDNRFTNLNVCFATFVAQDIGDLSINKGDIIVGINQVNEHWMQGQVCFDGQSNTWPNLLAGEQVGTFPLNHCWSLDVGCVERLCRNKIDANQRKVVTEASISQPWPLISQHNMNVSSISKKSRQLSTAQSLSLSSRSSSAYSANDNQCTVANRQYSYHDTTDNSSQNSNNNNNRKSRSNYDLNHINSDAAFEVRAPPRPIQLPTRSFYHSFSTDCGKSISKQAVAVRGQSSENSMNIINNKQQDKLRTWIHTVRKKTARLSTRITASLGLISLTRDEEFERHYDSFKQLEKTIKIFIKNISAFVEHYEHFLLALQHTSDNISEFYRDKTQNQRELVEMKRKNKALNCEHFHAFKRTVERQVISVSSQLLQKFSGPHQLVSKRSAKLLDYDTKTKEMDSCRDFKKKEALRDQYVIAKDLYDRINAQLIHELPIFNQFALDIFRECILVLLESRKNFILSYTNQTSSLLETPSMSSYTASDVASTILMSGNDNPPVETQSSSQQQQQISKLGRSTPVAQDMRVILNEKKFISEPQTGAYSQPSESNGGDALFTDETSTSRPHSALSQLSSDFGQVNGIVSREISSTPLSQISGTVELNNVIPTICVDEPDAIDAATNHSDRINISRISSNASSDNRHNQSIESRIEASRSKPHDIGSTPPPPRPPKSHAIADSDLDDNTMQQLRCHLNSGGKSKKKNKKSYPVYVASWPFVATGPNQLTIACNQHLKLIKNSDECGNDDWSLVKDKRGQLGYVPSSYITKQK